jgi:ABC-2 type transport system permease protein
MVQFKYRLLQTLRQKTNVFWGLFFPLLLATFFHISFGGIMDTENLGTIKAALVTEESNESFEQALAGLDRSILDLRKMEPEEAEKALAGGSVSGIFYSAKAPRLVVAENGTEETILSEILQQYQEYVYIASDLSVQAPDKIEPFFRYLQTDDTEYIRDVSLGGNSYDTIMDYFFALIAMACFFGCYTGQALGEQSAANVSPLAARRAVSPETRLKSILTDMTVGFLIQFLSVLILLFYLNFALGVHVLAHPAEMILITSLGCLLGVSYGIFIGTLNMKEGVKVLFTTAVPLFCCFLSGLMYGQMKQVIEDTVPIINRLNPAALISDAFYYMNIYENTAAFASRAAFLGICSAGITAVAIILLRRNRYASI